MTEDTFDRKLTDLVAGIRTLPVDGRKHLELLAEETRCRHRKLQETFKSLQQTIDLIRLGSKYIMFDLEATRRENQRLRKMIS